MIKKKLKTTFTILTFLLPLLIHAQKDGRKNGNISEMVKTAMKYLNASPAEKKSLAGKLKACKGSLDDIVTTLRKHEKKDYNTKTPILKEQLFKHPDLKSKYPESRLFYYIPQNYSPSVPFGLFIMMHGGGKGSPANAGKIYLTEHKKFGLGSYLKDIPFISVAPSAPMGNTSRRWNQRHTEEYLNDVVKESSYRFNIDKDKVILAGFSMGGMGAYGLGQRAADKFAAVMAASGKWSLGDFRTMRGTPMCIIHGENDAVATKRPRLTDVFYGRKAHELLNSANAENIYLEHTGGHTLSKQFTDKALSTFFSWIRDKKRNIYYPNVFAMTPSGAFPGYNITPHTRWISINETGNDYINVENVNMTGPPMARGESAEDFAKQRFHTEKYKLDKGGTIEATYLGKNNFKVKTTNIKTFSIWLSPKMIDFSKPVKISLNGKNRVYKDLAPNLLDTLRSYQRHNDWTMLYPFELKIDVAE